MDVERGVGAAEVDVLLLPFVADDQFAALEGGRQDDDQRRHHAVEFLAVPVRQEEAARLVQQQVVEVAFQLLLFQPQLLLHLLDVCRRNGCQSGFVRAKRSGLSRQTRRTLVSTSVSSPLP